MVGIGCFCYGDFREVVKERGWTGKGDVAWNSKEFNDFRL